MKLKVLRGILCLTLLLMLCVPAYAAETTDYTIKELGLQVSMPSDYIVFTREIDENDPNLDAYGQTKEELLAVMEKNNVYLYAWEQDYDEIIYFNMTPSEIEDFNLLSDERLSQMASTSKSQMGATRTVTKTELYQHAQAKFVKIYYNQQQNESSSYVLQYYTAYDNMAINIRFQSYTGELSPGQEGMLKAIIDSMAFGGAAQTPKTQSGTIGPYLYTDPESEATFTVPENWKETPLIEPSSYLKIQFTSVNNPIMNIGYGSADVFSQLSSSEKLLTPRSTINNRIFTKAQVGEMVEQTADAVSLKTYGSTEYYKVVVPYTETVNGVPITVKTTMMMTVENGYMYWFGIVGEEDGEYYKDFEALLSSVSLKKAQTTAGQIMGGQTTGGLPASYSSQNTYQRVDYGMGSILISLFISVLLYALPIVIYRYGVLKAPVEPQKAKKIAITYGCVAFFVAALFLLASNGNAMVGGGIVLWSYVNYRVLIGGTAQRTDLDTTQTQQSDNAHNATLADWSAKREEEKQVDWEEDDYPLD